MNIVSRDFNILWDFRSIAWGATLGYNGLRASAAGLVWAPILLLASNRFEPALLFYPILMPIAWLLFLLPMAFAVRFVTKFFPPAALVNLIFGLWIAVGDPIVCLLLRFFPVLVPVEKPALFSAAIVIPVLKQADAVEIVHAGPNTGVQSNRANTP